MSIIDAIILGTVQGLTEFLPVSSSGHLVIAQHLITGFHQPGVLFDVILHFGTLIAVLFSFRKEIYVIIRGMFNGSPHEKNYAGMIVAGSIPTAVIGLAGKDFFESFFHSVSSVGLMLIFTGLFLFFSHFIKDTSKKEIHLTDALLIGTAQGLAIMPGISRSGITISVGIFRHIDRERAASFSFLLSIPAVVGALLLEVREISTLAGELYFTYFVGAITAMIVGIISIKVLLFTLKSKRFFLFSGYCWFVGCITIFFLD